MSIRGLYINLDRRTDRDADMKQLIKRPFFSRTERFSACENRKGYIGCAESHVRCLEKLLESKEDTVMIVEDDLQIVDEKMLDRFVSSYEKIKDSSDWDVIVLTPVAHEYDSTEFMKKNGFTRVHRCQTTTGYIVKTAYIPTLHERFAEACEKLKENGVYKQYAIDQYWKALQNSDRFYAFDHRFGVQKPDHSDIKRKFINYTGNFGIKKKNRA